MAATCASHRNRAGGEPALSAGVRRGHRGNLHCGDHAHLSDLVAVVIVRCTQKLRAGDPEPGL